MTRIFNDITETIGDTPLVKINRIIKSEATVLAKIESANPLGSVKDRIALSIIDEGEKAGTIKPGCTIIEATSGNTGIGLALVCAARGYKCVIVMPDTMSIERRKVMKALGAEVILTPGVKGMPGAIEKADQLVAQTPGAVIAGQFDNPANPKIHRETTAMEIWNDTGGKVDIFIAGVGTGGTLTGVMSRLRELNPNVKSVAVEPAKSPVISQAIHHQTPTPSPHGIQGIGAGFIPTVLDMSLIDEVIQVNDDDALKWARLAANTEGLFVGISSGAALKAAAIVAARPENAGKNIVVILPSYGERYLSTALFADLQ